MGFAKVDVADEGDFDNCGCDGIKGSCTYYVITDGEGGSLQMITVLHRGGPANGYGIT